MYYIARLKMMSVWTNRKTISFLMHACKIRSFIELTSNCTCFPCALCSSSFVLCLWGCVGWLYYLLIGNMVFGKLDGSFCDDQRKWDINIV